MGILLIESVQENDSGVVITGSPVARRSLDEVTALWAAVQAAREDSGSEYKAAMENYRSLVGRPISLVFPNGSPIFKPGQVYFH